MAHQLDSMQVKALMTKAADRIELLDRLLREEREKSANLERELERTRVLMNGSLVS